MPSTIVRPSSRKNPLLDQQPKDHHIRNTVILGVIVLALIGVALLGLRSVGSNTGVSVVALPCSAEQDVTVFGDCVLYYDNASIHCLSASGGIRWSFSVGSGASFSCSDSQLVIWNGNQLYILDKNGKPSYNDSMNRDIQFARAGSKYVAVVIGDDTNPDLIVKNLDGTQEDEEVDAFKNLMLLDVGFFGENDQYMWTLAMDVYGTAINSVLNTFQVGKMNTGEASLGGFLAYRVIYNNSRLNVFTTQQMYVYDYKAVQDQSLTQLVYGWQLVDYAEVANRNANLLLAPNSQMNGSSSLNLTDLRVINGTSDLRYTLPAACVGAAVTDRDLYAFSDGYLYRADINKQRFYGYAIPLPEGIRVTGYIGLTSNGRAILDCGDSVYSVTLPQ